MRWGTLILVFGLAAAAGAAGEQKQDAKRQTELKKRDAKGGDSGEQKAGTQEVPPEEDETLVPKQEYSFNPLQASKELQIGNFYFKKGSYRAAAQRFREATRWDNGLAEAWLRLGEAQEKNKDRQAARDAYAKYLQVAPEARNAPEIRKKIEKLK